MKGPGKIHLVVFLLMIFPFAFIYSQAEQFKFRHITTKDGLSSHYVRCIIKDSRGFMWFSSGYGLVRYDGYSFKTYTNDPDDSTSIPVIQVISSMIEGPDGKIWIGTQQNMLVEFDPVMEVFTSYLMDSTIKENYRNWISNMFFDRSGNLWLGLLYEGFYCFNQQENTGTLYLLLPGEPIHKKNNVLSFLEMGDKFLLVGTSEGLYVLNRQTDSISPFKLPAGLPEDFDKAGFTSLLKDRNGTIWMGSDIGLFRFEPQTGKIVQLVNDPENPQSLTTNVIQHLYTNPLDEGGTIWVIVSAGSKRLVINRIDITTGIVERYQETGQENPMNVYDYYMDKSGLFWMATDNQGVLFIDMKDNPFHHYNVTAGDSGKEKFSGTAFYTDSRGDLWVGTGKGGLFRYDDKGNLKKRFENMPGSVYGFPTLVYSILEDSKNNFWISYWTDGLYRYNLQSDKFNRYEMHYPQIKLPESSSMEIIEDTFGRLWVGSMSGPFFTKVDQEHIEDINRVNNPVLGMSFVRSVCQDTSGSVWFTTEKNGLFCLPPENRDSLQFLNYRHDPEVRGSISSDIVFSVYCGDDGTLWIGTGNGLNRFNPETGDFDYFNMDNGFNAYFGYCVRTDGAGNVWATTEKGLARFNPDGEEGKKFKLFTVRDGLPFDKIYPYHFDKGKDGRFYLGGESGFGLGYFRFHPDSIKDNKLIPPLAITSFKVSNENFPLDTNIVYKKNISLRYDQNFISFEFASLDYNDPEKNKYAYKLEGVDDEWVYSGNRRFASYTGLSPGSYVFRVKGSNNDGYWNEAGTSIAFSIATPPWKTGWAYAIYVVFAIGILLTIIRYYLRRQHLLHRLELEHLEADKLKEVDSMKSRFFANISHEFRTPLTLILGPLNKLLESATKEKEKKELTVMQRNARRLQQLINQLLDLSKLEAGKMQLQCSEMNLTEWVRMYIQSFESLARQRKIDFVFEAGQEDIRCWFDPEKMAQVLNNLLSNAFKFAEKDGAINVSINKPTTSDFRLTASDPTGQWVGIKISDTGPGIPPEKLPHIFNRFYQADDAQTRKFEGTGIGLALVKELVELHHGNITVESDPDGYRESKGTTFSIVLPLGKEHLKPEEIIDPASAEALTDKLIKREDIPEQLTQTFMQKTLSDDDIEKDDSKPLLLIVEDNDDLRSYIRSYLTSDYYISEAVDGGMGLKKAIEKIPDLVISDVMMPGMDGMQLCRKLKTDERTSHIPVILLTAKAAKEDRLEGLETGADDFLTKPFDPDELQVRIKNLIDQRKKLSEHFKKYFDIIRENQKEQILSMDEKFLQKARTIITKNLSNSEYDVEDFASDMALSRVQLYRKLKALVDQSVTEFIRTIRLNHAVGLLKKGAGTISEIAYDVGFSDPNYFTTSFRKQFGMSPSEYLVQNPDSK